MIIFKRITQEFDKLKIAGYFLNKLRKVINNHYLSKTKGYVSSYMMNTKKQNGSFVSASIYRRPVVRPVAWVLLFLFVWTSFVGDTHAYTLGSSLFKSKEGGAQAQDSVSFVLPQDLGTVRDFYLPKGAEKRPFVVHIQDAHANPDAQKSTQSILNYLLENSNKKESFKVAVEAAEGEILPEYLDMFPDHPKVNDAIVSELLDKGELTGAELFAWDVYKRFDKKIPNNISILGVESPELYRENLKTYRQILFQKESTRSLLNDVRKIYEVAKSRILSPSLRQFIQERERRKYGNYAGDQFSKGNKTSPQFLSYLTFLSTEAYRELQIDFRDTFEQIRFPNLFRVLLLQELESVVNGEQAKLERQKIEALVSKRLFSKMDAGLFEEFKNLESSHAPRRILEDVWTYAAKQKIDLAKYGAFWKWAASKTLQSEIETLELFEEIARLEEWIIDKLIQADEERELITLLNRFDLFNKLINLHLTRKDFDTIQSDKKSIFRAALGQDVIALLKTLGSGRVSDGFQVPEKAQQRLGVVGQAAIKFYINAVKRDEVLLENTLKGVSQDNPAILISGGFHTQGFTELMQEKNVGYAVIQPKMETHDDGDRYYRALRGKNADVSAYFEKPYLTKQEAVYLKSILEVGVPRLWEDYKIPHSDIGNIIAKSIVEHPILSARIYAEAESLDLRSVLRVELNDEGWTPQREVIPVQSNAVMIALLTVIAASFNRMYAPLRRERAPAGGSQRFDLSIQAPRGVSLAVTRGRDLGDIRGADLTPTETPKSEERQVQRESRSEARQAYKVPEIHFSKFYQKERFDDRDREFYAFAPPEDKVSLTLKIDGNEIAGKILNSDGTFSFETTPVPSYDRNEGENLDQTIKRLKDRTNTTDEDTLDALQEETIDRLASRILELVEKHLIDAGVELEEYDVEEIIEHLGSIEQIGISSPGPFVEGGVDGRGNFASRSPNLPFKKGLILKEAVTTRLFQKFLETYSAVDKKQLAEVFQHRIIIRHDAAAGGAGELSPHGTFPVEENTPNIFYLIWSQGIGGALYNGKAGSALSAAPEALTQRLRPGGVSELFPGGDEVDHLLGEVGHQLVWFPETQSYEWVGVWSKGEQHHLTDELYKNFQDVEDRLSAENLLRRFGRSSPYNLRPEEVMEAGLELGRMLGAYSKAIQTEYGEEYVPDKIVIGQEVTQLGLFHPYLLNAIQEGFQLEIDKPLEKELGYRHGLVGKWDEFLSEVEAESPYDIDKEFEQILAKKFGKFYAANYMRARRAEDVVDVQKQRKLLLQIDKRVRDVVTDLKAVVNKGKESPLISRAIVMIENYQFNDKTGAIHMLQEAIDLIAQSSTGNARADAYTLAMRALEETEGALRVFDVEVEKDFKKWKTPKDKLENYDEWVEISELIIEFHHAVDEPLEIEAQDRDEGAASKEAKKSRRLLWATDEEFENLKTRLGENNVYKGTYAGPHVIKDRASGNRVVHVGYTGIESVIEELYRKVDEEKAKEKKKKITGKVSARRKSKDTKDFILRVGDAEIEGVNVQTSGAVPFARALRKAFSEWGVVGTVKGTKEGWLHIAAGDYTYDVDIKNDGQGMRYLRNFIEDIVSVSPAGASTNPNVTIFSGGSAAPGLLAPIIRKLRADESPLRIVALLTNTDDGGSSWDIVDGLVNEGYGIYPPFGDIGNALFNSFAKIWQKDNILDDGGRLRDKANQEKPITWHVQKRLDQVKADYGHDEDFSHEEFQKFEENMLKWMGAVDREFFKGDRHLKTTGGKSIKEGASIRNLVIMGALIDLGVLTRKYKGGTQKSGIPTGADQKKFQEVLDHLRDALDIEDGQVSVSSYDPTTLFARYEENVIIFEDTDGQSRAIAVRTDPTTKDVYVRDAGETEREIIHPLKEGEDIEIGGVKFGNEGGKPTIENNRDKRIIDESKDGNVTHLVKSDFSGKIKLQNDGSGREEGKKGGIEIGGTKFRVRTRLVTKQTNITETPNFSKIIDIGPMEFRSEDPGRDGRPQEANQEAVERIENTTDMIFMGPGSLHTSLLTHFFSKDIVQAMLDKKDTPVQRVFIFNPNRDNETMRMNISDQIKLIETVASRTMGRPIKFEDLFDATVINDGIDPNFAWRGRSETRDLWDFRQQTNITETENFSSVSDLRSEARLAESPRLIEFDPPKVRLSRFSQEADFNDMDREFYAFLPEPGKYSITLKIGGTSIAAKILNSDGEFIAVAEPLSSYGKVGEQDYEEAVAELMQEQGIKKGAAEQELLSRALDRMTLQIASLVERGVVDIDDIETIGISSPGPFRNGGTDGSGTFDSKSPNLPFQEGLSLRQAIGDRLKSSILQGKSGRDLYNNIEVMHDGAAGGAGERSAVGTVPGEDLLYVIWGTGIGGGLFLDGNLFPGGEEINYLLGEVGHHHVFFPETGRYEYIGFWADGKQHHLTDRYFKGYKDVEDINKGPAINARFGKSPEHLTISDIQQIGREFGRAFAQYFKAVYAQYGYVPDNFVIGSGVSHLGRRGPYLLEAIEAGMEEEYRRPVDQELGFIHGEQMRNGDLQRMIDQAESPQVKQQELENEYGAYYVQNYLLGQKIGGSREGGISVEPQIIEKNEILGQKTRVIAEIDPLTITDDKVRELLESGATSFQISLTPMDAEDYKKASGRIFEIQKIAQKVLGHSITIVQKIEEGVVGISSEQTTVALAKDSEAFLFADGANINTSNIGASAKRIQTDYDGLATDLQPGQKINVRDKAIVLEVVSTSESRKYVKVKVVENPKRQRLTRTDVFEFPETDFYSDALSGKQKEDLYAGLRNVGVHAVSVDVGRAGHIQEIKDRMKKYKREISLIARLTSRQGVNELDEILQQVSAIAIDRDSLAKFYAPQEINQVITDIILRARARGVSVVVDGNIVPSMVDKNTPSAGEVLDISTLVSNGVSAIVLDQQVVNNDYVSNAVDAVNKAAVEVEGNIDEGATPQPVAVQQARGLDLKETQSEKSNKAAYLNAKAHGANAIVTFTRSGRSAREIVRLNPGVPVIAVTPSEKTYHELVAVGAGIIPILVSSEPSATGSYDYARSITRDIFREEVAAARAADRSYNVVFTYGTIGVSGATNTSQVIDLTEGALEDEEQVVETPLIDFEPPEVLLSKFSQDANFNDMDREFYAFLPSEGKVSITLKIGGTSIAAKILNHKGEFIEVAVPSSSYGKIGEQDYEEAVEELIEHHEDKKLTRDGAERLLLERSLDRMAEQIRGLLESEKIQINDVETIGISSPGPFRNGGTDGSGTFDSKSPNLPFYEGTSLREEIGARLEQMQIRGQLNRDFREKIQVMHDGAAGGAGERSAIGTVAGEDLLYVIWGTGIGGGLFLDGKLFPGGEEEINFLLGEVGHHHVYFPETERYEYVGFWADGKQHHLTDHYFNQFKDVEDINKGPAINARFGKAPEHLTIGEIRQIGREFGRAFAQYFKAIHAQYGRVPKNFVIGSGVSHLGRRGPDLLDAIKAGMNEEYNRPVNQELGFIHGENLRHGDLQYLIDSAKDPDAMREQLDNKYGAFYVSNYLLGQKIGGSQAGGARVEPQIIESRGIPQQKTKTSMTIDPLTINFDKLVEAMEQGIHVFEIDYSNVNGTAEFTSDERTGEPVTYYDAIARQIFEIQKLAQTTLGHSVTIIQNLSPVLPLVDEEQKSFQIGQGTEFVIKARGGRVGNVGNKKVLSLDFEGVATDLQVGDELVIGDNRILLEVTKVNAALGRVDVRVTNKPAAGQGWIKAGNKVYYPSDRDWDIHPLNQGHSDDFKSGLRESGAHAVAISVRDEEDVALIFERMESLHRTVPLIAKIDSAQAVRKIEVIIEALAKYRGAIQVDMNLLTAELDAEGARGALDVIVERAIPLGIPVSVRGESPEQVNPAALSEFSEFVSQGTSNIVLEQSLIDQPGAVETLNRTIKFRETLIDDGDTTQPKGVQIARDQAPDEESKSERTIKGAMLSAPVHDAKAFIVFTRSGKAALEMARLNPGQPIIAITPDETTFHYLASNGLGVTPVLVTSEPTATGRYDYAAAVASQLLSDEVERAKKRNEVFNVIFTYGPIGESGGTDTSRVMDLVIDLTGKTRRSESRDDDDGISRRSFLSRSATGLGAAGLASVINFGFNQSEIYAGYDDDDNVANVYVTRGRGQVTKVTLPQGLFNRFFPAFKDQKAAVIMTNNDVEQMGRTEAGRDLRRSLMINHGVLLREGETTEDGLSDLYDKRYALLGGTKDADAIKALKGNVKGLVNESGPIGFVQDVDQTLMNIISAAAINKRVKDEIPRFKDDQETELERIASLLDASNTRLRRWPVSLSIIDRANKLKRGEDAKALRIANEYVDLVNQEGVIQELLIEAAMAIILSSSYEELLGKPTLDIVKKAALENLGTPFFERLYGKLTPFLTAEQSTAVRTAVVAALNAKQEGGAKQFIPAWKKMLHYEQQAATEKAVIDRDLKLLTGDETTRGELGELARTEAELEKARTTIRYTATELEARLERLRTQERNAFKLAARSVKRDFSSALEIQKERLAVEAQLAQVKGQRVDVTTRTKPVRAKDREVSLKANELRVKLSDASKALAAIAESRGRVEVAISRLPVTSLPIKDGWAKRYLDNDPKIKTVGQLFGQPISTLGLKPAQETHLTGTDNNFKTLGDLFRLTKRQLLTATRGITGIDGFELERIIEQRITEFGFAPFDLTLNNRSEDRSVQVPAESDATVRSEDRAAIPSETVVGTRSEARFTAAPDSEVVYEEVVALRDQSSSTGDARSAVVDYFTGRDTSRFDLSESANRTAGNLGGVHGTVDHVAETTGRSDQEAEISVVFVVVKNDMLNVDAELIAMIAEMFPEAFDSVDADAEPLHLATIASGTEFQEDVRDEHFSGLSIWAIAGSKNVFTVVVTDDPARANDDVNEAELEAAYADFLDDLGADRKLASHVDVIVVNSMEPTAIKRAVEHKTSRMSRTHESGIVAERFVLEGYNVDRRRARVDQGGYGISERLGLTGAFVSEELVNRIDILDLQRMLERKGVAKDAARRLALLITAYRKRAASA